MSERKEEVVAKIGRKRNQQQRENVMSEQAVVEGEVGPAAPLTGSNDARDANLMELGRSLEKVIDLNSVRASADTVPEFTALRDYKGKPLSDKARQSLAWKKMLKFPVMAKGGNFPNAEAKGYWQMDGSVRPNPLNFAPEGYEQCDIITPTFVIADTPVDHDTPSHFLSEAEARRMSYGHMRGKAAILLESYFQADMPKKTWETGTRHDGTTFKRQVESTEHREWWSATAILYPKGVASGNNDCPVLNWYKEVVSNMLCLASFDDYVPTEDEERETVDQVHAMEMLSQRFDSLY